MRTDERGRSGSSVPLLLLTLLASWPLWLAAEPGECTDWPPSAWSLEDIPDTGWQTDCLALAVLADGRAVVAAGGHKGVRVLEGGEGAWSVAFESEAGRCPIRLAPSGESDGANATGC